MAVKTYSPEEVFAAMDSLDSTESAPATETKATNSTTNDVSELEDYTVPGLEQSSAVQEAAPEPMPAGFDWKEKLARPVIEGILNPKETLKGALKGAGDTLLGAARFGEAMFENTVGQIPRAWGGPTLVEGREYKEMEAKLYKAFEAQNKAQEFGKFSEGIAEAVVPGTKTAKAVEIAGKAYKTGKLATAAMDIAAQSGLAAATTAIKEGEITPEAAKSALITAGLTGVFRGLGGAYSSVMKKSPSEDVARSILGPMKSSAESFDDAAKGVSAIAESFDGGAGKISKELSQSAGKEGFDKLAKRGTELQNGIWDDITETLLSAKKPVRTTEANEALELAKDTLGKQPGRSAAKKALEIENLINKNREVGLTPIEMNRAKVLFGEAENMYNSMGSEVRTKSAEALRDVRNGLKQRVESEVEKQIPGAGKKVQELNDAYGKIASAKNMLENRSAQFTVFERPMREKLLPRIVETLANLPGVKQIGTDPLRKAVQVLGMAKGAEKMSILDIEKRIPSLLGELKKANLPKEQFNAVSEAISQTLRAAAKEAQMKYEDTMAGELPNA